MNWDYDYNPADILQSLIGFVAAVVELLLGLRFLLKLLGARVVPFVAWIYDSTAPLLAPFRGMFPSPEIAQTFELEFSTLFAIIIYSLIAYLLRELIEYLEIAAKRRA